MLSTSQLIEFIWLLGLIIYVSSLIRILTKKTYEQMIQKGVTKDSAIYYNRKLVHILAGGVVALLVPIAFSSPIYPLFCGMALTGLTLLSHRRKKLMYWFQTENNLYDVNFCLMWGLSIYFLWIITNNPWIAIIPAAFMSFGDGITGIIRNIVIRKREKHFIGNIYMAGVCLPLGYGLGGLGEISVGGAIAALAASIVERYEYGIIDDNVLVAVSSSVLLYIYHFLIF
jgi:hypothetical protein